MGSGPEVESPIPASSSSTVNLKKLLGVKTASGPTSVSALDPPTMAISAIPISDSANEQSKSAQLKQLLLKNNAAPTSTPNPKPAPSTSSVSKVVQERNVKARSGSVSSQGSSGKGQDIVLSGKKGKGKEKKGASDVSKATTHFATSKFMDSPDPVHMPMPDFDEAFWSEDANYSTEKNARSEDVSVSKRGAASALLGILQRK